MIMKTKTGYSIFIDALFEGPVPIERDEVGLPVVYSTEEEAHKAIANYVIDRWQQFIDGERDFEDAVTMEEYVVPVEVLSDGTIRDECDVRYVSSRIT